MLTDNACSLRLIQGYINCLNNYRHRIHRETFESITNTIKSRCTSGLRTHLGKIKAHNYSIGNDLADSLANLVADGHPLDTTYTTCSDTPISTLTWPYTLIALTQGGPTPYRYTNPKADAHNYITKHTHIRPYPTPLSMEPSSPAPRQAE
jgi:hypothetical protein